MYLTKYMYSVLLVICLCPNGIVGNTNVSLPNNYEITVIPAGEVLADDLIALIPRGYQEFVHNTTEAESLVLYKRLCGLIVVYAIFQLILHSGK